MLRGTITGVALALALIALVVTAIQPAEWPLLLGAGILLLGTAGEQWRYQRSLSVRRPGAWQDTGERFTDPDTGRAVRVLYDPATGDRSYADDGAGPTNP